MHTRRVFSLVLVIAVAWWHHFIARILPFIHNGVPSKQPKGPTTGYKSTERETFGITKSTYSPVCRPSWRRNTQGVGPPVRRLFFSHTRKAGGTMLVKFFRLVARSHGWNFVSVEGTPAEEPTRNDTLYVTHLREPVARAISMYRYGGRWSCRKLVFPQQYPDFIPTANNSRTLEEYIEKESDKLEQQQCLKIPERRKKLWGCAKNCYLRWYGKPFNCLADIEKSYRTAKEKLLGYNLIVILERMSDPMYVKGLLRMFGILESDILSTTQKIHCANESRFWNDKNPAIIKKSTLRNLTNLNKWDIRLYKELNDCPEGIEFPTFQPGLPGQADTAA